MAANVRMHKRKQRNCGTRMRKPVVYMIAEGKNKTETLYFKDFGKDVNRVIRFAPGTQTDPVNMVVGLRGFMNENDYDPNLGDKAFCLVDADVNLSKNIQIAKADKLAEECGIQLIMSAPSFEYWYLCHFMLSGKKYISNAGLISDIKKHIPGYEKGNMEIYALLKERTDRAINNARSMEKRNIGYGYQLHSVDFTPSTEVYHIAEELMS